MAEDKLYLIASNLKRNKRAFERKPTARFGIEIQTLTIRFSKDLKITLTFK